MHNFDNQQLCKKAAQCVPPIRVSSTGTYTQNFMEMVNDYPCVLLIIFKMKRMQLTIVHLLWPNRSKNYHTSDCDVTVVQFSDLRTARAQ